jgi:glucosamine kinase
VHPMNHPSNLLSPSRVLVVGVDAGGTRTRALVADLEGKVHGRAEGDGANPVTHGLEQALRTLHDTIANALQGIDPTMVGHVMLALAGDYPTRQPGPARALAAMLEDAGLRCPHSVVGDALAAFAAATPERGGCLLISGTGSVAVRIREHRIVDNAGGYGWLLGDGGSGFWLGREAARAAVDTLRGRAQAPQLTRLVCTALLGAPEPEVPGAAGAEQLLTALYAGPPHRLSALAPYVVRASEAGDPDAAPILERAARHLDQILDQLGPRIPGEPVVLAGSCLADEVLGRRTAKLVLARGPALLLRAQDNAAGAAWLAAARMPGQGPDRLTRLHRVLTRPDRS